MKPAKKKDLGCRQNEFQCFQGFQGFHGTREFLGNPWNELIPNDDYADGVDWAN